MSETCWVCLRITPEYVLKSAHKLWSDSAIAREMAKVTSELIEEKYAENRFFFCSKTAKTVVGGLFYLLGAFEQKYPIQKFVYVHYDSPWYNNQRLIAESLDTTEVSIRISYKRWLKTFPELLRGVEERYHWLQQREKYIASVGHRHRWKYVRQLNWVRTMKCECGETKEVKVSKPKYIGKPWWRR